MTRGSEALRAHAPAAARAIDEVRAAAWRDASSAGLSDLVELVSRVCARVSGLTPLAPPAGDGPGRWADQDPSGWRSIDGLTDAQTTALEFAEQFSVDVSSISDEQRHALSRNLGGRSPGFAATVFVMDFLPRTSAALDALFDSRTLTDPVGTDPPVAPVAPFDPAADSGLWDALDTFTRAVPRLDTLDPVTTELVRLRGARQHRCRICGSLRSRPALVAGADEQTFSSVDDFENSDVSFFQKAALSFTDAMIWTPGNIAATAIEAVRRTATPAQRVELVLDITRNALNKVAVALAADGPHIEDGVEIFDIDALGNLVYGVSLD